MKIYIDLAKQAITKTSDEKVYEGDFYSNVFEVLFYNYENENWFPTMSQLAPNGRSAGDFTADALGVGESHTYVEDGTTYLRFTFTMGATWVLMKGRSEFYIWLNRIGGSIVQKKCVGRVNVMIDQSTDNYFIADPLFNPAVKTYINACVAEIGDGSPKYFDTAANIALLTEDKGLAVATDTGHLYYWDSTSTSTTKYTDSGLVYNDLSLYYTKTQSDNKYAKLGANNIFTGDNDFRGESLFDDDINQAYGNFSTQGNVEAEGNVEAQSFTKNGTDLDDIYASKSDTYTKTETDNLLNNKANKSTTYTKTETDTLLNTKANKTNTYTKSEVDTALNDKADKSTTYTKTETDNLLSAKADKTTVNGIDNRIGALETDIDTLKSVQNVVDIVATYSALQSYVTTNLDVNDKVQVIADETHSGASTIYNWNGSAWEYIGAYGGNSYTKVQTDTLLDGKADKSTTYTKAEIDTILNTVVIEKYFDELPTDEQITITGYVTQEVLNSIGPRTQVKLRVYDSDNDMTFILTQNSTGKNGYNFKCTVNSPLTDGMIEVDGAIYDDREYTFVLRSIRIYTEGEVNTLLNDKMNKANPTGTGSISMNDGTASGTNSYANGSGATASGNFSTAVHGTASGSDSIAYGNSANASGDSSIAFGDQCKAKGNNQVVTGKFNIPDTSSLEIVGNGAYMNTSNARLLDANGNEYLKGDIYVNSTFTKDANGDLDTKSGTKLVAVSANPTLAGTEADLTGLEVDGTKYKISSGGGSSTPLLEDIVDSKGNKRFVEGYGTPLTKQGFTSSYCKWSLSGTHLMIVLAASIDANVYIGQDPSYLAKYELPSYITNKIYPVSSGSMGDVIEIKSLVLYDANATSQQITTCYFKKETNGVGLYSAADLHATGKTFFRIQFDLLIDADYSE